MLCPLDRVVIGSLLGSVCSNHRFLDRFTVWSIHVFSGTGINQKVFGCLYNVHATNVSMDISCHNSHYCRYKGLQLGKTVDDELTGYPDSLPSTFQHDKNYPSGKNLPTQYQLDFCVLWPKCMVFSAMGCYLPVLLGNLKQNISNSLYCFGHPWPTIKWQIFYTWYYGFSEY